MIYQFSVIPHLNKSDQEWAEFVVSNEFDDVCTAWLHAWKWHSQIIATGPTARHAHFEGFFTALQYINLANGGSCSICGGAYTIGKIVSAVYVGRNENGEELTAHKKCWEEHK